MTLKNKPPESVIAFCARLSTNYVHTGGSAYSSDMPFNNMLVNAGGAYNFYPYTLGNVYQGMYLGVA